jgi:hypothetical protein
VRKLLITSVAIVLGCSSGNGGTKDAGPVDPAALGFCLHWANGVCRLAYLCTDAGSEDAAFHDRYGQSQENCWEGIEKLCTGNQSSSPFGPTCGPGKVVNAASAQACADDLDTESCIAWKAAPAGACESVCGATSSLPAGGAGGAGGAATGMGGAATGMGGAATGIGAGAGGLGAAGASNGTLATPDAYCNASLPLACERAFECSPAAAAMRFGDLAMCKATVATFCSLGDFCPNGYGPDLAASCLAARKAATCQDLMGPAPMVCTSACLG